MGEAGVRFAKAALPTYGKSNGVAFGACDTQLASNGQRLLVFGGQRCQGQGGQGQGCQGQTCKGQSGQGQGC